MKTITSDAFRLELAKGMSEKRLMENIVQTAKTFGWRCYHTWDSRRSEPGFPDLILCRGNTMLAIECKRQGGSLSDAQSAWLYDLARVRRVEIGVWTPDMWIDGRIERRLKESADDGR